MKANRKRLMENLKSSGIYPNQDDYATQAELEVLRIHEKSRGDLEPDIQRKIAKMLSFKLVKKLCYQNQSASQILREISNCTALCGEVVNNTIT